MIGTASATKHEYLRELGAIPTTYGPGLEERVRQLAPKGVDRALDVAGSGIIPELIEIVHDPARVLSVADFIGSAIRREVLLRTTEKFRAGLCEIGSTMLRGAIPVACGTDFPA